MLMIAGKLEVELSCCYSYSVAAADIIVFFNSIDTITAIITSCDAIDCICLIFHFTSIHTVQLLLSWTRQNLINAVKLFI